MNLDDFPSFVTTPGCLLWRAHRADGPVLRFSNFGSGRFDPPAERPADYGTCYLSTTPADAFLEKFGRVGPYLADRLVRGTAVTEISTTVSLRFADLTDVQAVGEYFTGYELGLKRS